MKLIAGPRNWRSTSGTQTGGGGPTPPSRSVGHGRHYAVGRAVLNGEKKNCSGTWFLQK